MTLLHMYDTDDAMFIHGVNTTFINRSYYDTTMVLAM